MAAPAMTNRPRTALALLAPLLTASLAGCGGGPSKDTGTGGGGATTTTTTSLGSVDDIMGTLPCSCSLDCPSDCAEPDTPYACPTVLPYAELPHDTACGAWD